MLQPAQNQAQITKLYKRVGMKPPVGRGMHTMAFHKLVTSLYKKVDNPYAVAMAKLGRDKAVRKEHRR